MKDTFEINFTKPEIESLLVSLLLTSYFTDGTKLENTYDPIMKRLLLMAEEKGFGELVQKIHGRMIVSDEVIKKCMAILAKCEDEPIDFAEVHIIKEKEIYAASLN